MNCASLRPLLRLKRDFGTTSFRHLRKKMNLSSEPRKSKLPKRIILIRHCESEGNADPMAYAQQADWRVPLSAKGREQAAALGRQIKDIVGNDPLYIYCSPYRRTKQTLALAMPSLADNPVVGVREEPRLTEQQFGNLQNPETMQGYKGHRESFGRFYYRFPDGESGLDVYNRVTSFIGTLFRLWSRSHDSHDDVNVVIFTHGLTLRLFLMRWFRLTVQEFETSKNPENGCIIVMDRFTEYDAAVMAAEELGPPSALRRPSFLGSRRIVSKALELDEEEFDGDDLSSVSNVGEANASTGDFFEVSPLPLRPSLTHTPGRTSGHAHHSWSRFSISDEDMKKIGLNCDSPMFVGDESPSKRLEKILREAFEDELYT